MRRILVLLVLIVFGVTIGFLWWSNGMGAVEPLYSTMLPAKDKIFVIEKGKGVREIAADLKREDLIRDPVVFFLYVKLIGRDTQIQAGDYRLSPSMSLTNIVNTLSHGTIDVWITIPEGLRTEEIERILKKEFKQYDDTSWSAILTKNNGYLFPDTYLIPKNAGIDRIVALMTDNFFQKIKQLGLDKNTLDLNNIVILASLVERETKTKEERPIIAGILQKRKEAQWFLQVDATVQYAVASTKCAIQVQVDTCDWWPKITRSDLSIDSFFNTYKYRGLPPEPIANPGLSSIAAVVEHKESSYWYYLHDEEGHVHYATTIEEHNRNVKKYVINQSNTIRY